MKTLDEINEARKTLKSRVMGEGPALSKSQLALLCGALDALVWAAEGVNCSTMQGILDGEPFATEPPMFLPERVSPETECPS